MFELDKVFMVRGSAEGTGFFNSNYELKLLYLAGIALLIAIDWLQSRRRDYLSVFTTGTITWTLAEFFLQTSGTRDLQDVYVFGWLLPFPVQVLVKGMVEGAGVAVFCLFFADRCLAASPRERWTCRALFLGCMLLMFLDAFRHGIQAPNYGGAVPSRRSMLEPVPLLFLATFSALGVGWLACTRHADLRRRGLSMALLMLAFGATWTVGEYRAGTRWIETGSFAASAHASPVVELCALAFDVVVEITAVYLAFITIPVLKGRIKPASEEVPGIPDSWSVDRATPEPAVIDCRVT